MDEPPVASPETDMLKKLKKWFLNFPTDEELAEFPNLPIILDVLCGAPNRVQDEQWRKVARVIRAHNPYLPRNIWKIRVGLPGDFTPTAYVLADAWTVGEFVAEFEKRWRTMLRIHRSPKMKTPIIRDSKLFSTLGVDDE